MALRMAKGKLVGYASGEAQFRKVWAPRGWELQDEPAPEQDPPAGGDGTARAPALADGGATGGPDPQE